MLAQVPPLCATAREVHAGTDAERRYTSPLQQTVRTTRYGKQVATLSPSVLAS